MKKIISISFTFILFVATTVVLSSFKKNVQEIYPKDFSEACSNWSGSGIQFRWCETDWGLRSYQFYNGYKFKVHFYFFLEYTDGTNSGNNGNIYLNADSYSDKGSTDNASGTNHKVQTWRITKKERQDSAGKWVEF